MQLAITLVAITTIIIEGETADLPGTEVQIRRKKAVAATTNTVVRWRATQFHLTHNRLQHPVFHRPLPMCLVLLVRFM